VRIPVEDGGVGPRELRDGGVEENEVVGLYKRFIGHHYQVRDDVFNPESEIS